jgi:hypothetical protein
MQVIKNQCHSLRLPSSVTNFIIHQTNKSNSSQSPDQPQILSVHSQPSDKVRQTSLVHERRSSILAQFNNSSTPVHANSALSSHKLAQSVDLNNGFDFSSRRSFWLQKEMERSLSAPSPPNNLNQESGSNAQVQTQNLASIVALQHTIQMCGVLQK